MLLLIFFFSSHFRSFSCSYDHATENEILGDPVINCTENGIHFQVNTRLPFNGRIFAQGKVEDADCVKVYSEGGVGPYDNSDRGLSTKPFMIFGFETCGMDAVVSTEPQGIYFSVKLTVSFHRLLITKNDKFFKAKCFFAETRTSVNQHLEVRNSDPIEYLTSHHTSPCNYAMYNASYVTFEEHRDLGPPLTYAQVGDRILHVWSCPDHFYGIMVYDCYVTDGNFQNLTVVDDKGYGRGLHEAYAESQVFKFAEKPIVYFHCRIEECDVNKTETCPSFMQPRCDYNHHPSAKLSPLDAAPPAFSPPRSGPYNNDVPATDGFVQQHSKLDSFVESISVDSLTASKESINKMNLKRLNKFSPTLLDIPLDGEKIDIPVRNRLSNRVSQQHGNTKPPIFQNVKGHLIILDSGEETKSLPVKKSQTDEEREGEESTVELVEEKSQLPDQCWIATTETLIVVFICYTFVCIFLCAASLMICRKICCGAKAPTSSSSSMFAVNIGQKRKSIELSRM